MNNLLARVPAVIVAIVCVLWIVALIAIPLLYSRVMGWGHYWALSFDELLRSLAFLLGPPLLFVLIWRRARRRSHGEGAV